MSDRAVVKIFHYARFDLAAIAQYLGVHAAPLWCTKIASKLVRTYTDRHGLKDLCRELLDVDLSKAQQSFGLGAPDLSDAQLNYAASDVLHLHALKDRPEIMLDREGRRPMAEACFDFCWCARPWTSPALKIWIFFPLIAHRRRAKADHRPDLNHER
ncbi:MAG: hypothetical protein CM15mP55_2480 [Hyphomicrobiales bacterium]|nr:MAG: hypothetical protein CM15mP55_2480 [Hyphomicrobiales bacterium]